MSAPEWYEKNGELYTKNTDPLSNEIEAINHGRFTLTNVLRILNEMEESRHDLILEFLAEAETE